MPSLKVDSEFSSKGFEAGIGRMKQATNSFQGSLSGIQNMLLSAFSIGALVRSVRNAVQLGSDLSDMATQTGTSTKAFQVYDYAAKEAGASSEQLRNALVKLRDSQGQVIDKNEIAIKNFKRLGIEARTVAGLNTDDLFMEVARAVANSENSVEAYSAAIDILGQKNAPMLMEALQRLGTDGFDAVAKKAQDAGQIMDEALIKQLDEAQDSIQRLQNRWTILVAQFIGGLTIIGSSIRKYLGEDSFKVSALPIAQQFVLIKRLAQSVAGDKNAKSWKESWDEVTEDYFKYSKAIDAEENRRAAERKANLDKFDEKVEEKTGLKDVKTKQVTDELLRMGGVLGSIGSGEMLSLGRLQLNAAEKMSLHLENIDKKITGDTQGGGLAP